MTASVALILTEALYLAGMGDPIFDPVDPSGSTINTALKYFIDSLDVYQNQIPFWEEKILNGEEELNDINASAINFVKYLIGSVYYGLKRCTQSEFAQVSTVKDLRAIPAWYWFEKGKQKIHVYPLPDLSGRQFLIGFKPYPLIKSVNEVLPLAIKPFMQIFLEYDVASNLCNRYKLPWTNKMQERWQLYYDTLLNNMETAVGEPREINLTGKRYNIPYLAYLSGNFP